jgi:hypothetical protein
MGEDDGMSLSRKLHAALAVVAIGWFVVFVFWRPAPFAASFDDAYYYFAIGRNWAQGHVSTFDLIDRTNGYHPLWQLICTVPYLLGIDGTAAVRSLLVLQLAIWIGALHLLIDQVVVAVDGWSKLGDDTRARRWCELAVVVVFVALAANPFVTKMIANGLESGLVVPIGAALIAWSLRFRGRFVSRASRRQRLLAGGLLAVAFLARTDSVILIASVAVWCLLDDGTRREPVPISARLRRTIELLVVPVVVIVAYLVTNLVWFDTALQISGTVKRLPFTPVRAVLALVWAALGLAVLLGARRPIKASSRAKRARRFLSGSAWYATFCVGLLGYYTTLQSVPYLWYFAPLALEAVWLAMLFTADLAEGAVLDARPASTSDADTEAATVHGALGAKARAPVAILAVPLLVALAWSIKSYVDPGARALMVHDAKAGTWISTHLPPDARVASWDAGVIGYFSQRRVVNLDGVVNSIEYYRATQDGTVNRFLADRNVRWVANHGGDVNGADPGVDRQIRNYLGKVAARRITVVYRDTYDYTGSLDGSRTDTSDKRMGTYVYRLDR